jgi:hypothetical protein
MVAQSAAEMLADRCTDKKVLFAALNGRESMDYVREKTESVDAMKDRVENRLLNTSELQRLCVRAGKMYLLAGTVNEEYERCYMPENAVYILEAAAKLFDIIVVDAGNNIDNGLAVGAISVCGELFLVMTQQESILARWEKRQRIYERLRIVPDVYVLNRYFEKDIYPADYVARRCGKEGERFGRVRFVYSGRRAEIERKTLLNYPEDGFRADIARLAAPIAEHYGYAEQERKRKKLWKNFI